ncbi:MAG: hypothetical protein ABSA16_12445 [Thermoguttaceae bacterium]|jgi:hypothetical protein
MKRPTVFRSFNTSNFLSRHRSALAAALLLFSAVLLASVSNAKADLITYNLVPISGAEGTLTGQINYSGPNIIITDPPIISGSLTFTPNGQPPITYGNETFDSVYFTSWNTGAIEFTDNSIEVNLTTSGLAEAINAYSFAHSSNISVSWWWAYSELGGTEYVTPPSPYSPFYASTTYETDSSNGFSIVATVIPEPTTLTLLASSLLGLGLVYLRRRGAKA